MNFSVIKFEGGQNRNVQSFYTIFKVFVNQSLSAFFLMFPFQCHQKAVLLQQITQTILTYPLAVKYSLAGCVERKTLDQYRLFEVYI